MMPNLKSKLFNKNLYSLSYIAAYKKLTNIMETNIVETTIVFKSFDFFCLLSHFSYLHIPSSPHGGWHGDGKTYL